MSEIIDLKQITDKIKAEEAPRSGKMPVVQTCPTIKEKSFFVDHTKSTEFVGKYDELYIEHYCNHPEQGKTAAILYAGYVGDYSRQAAHKLHSRLRPQIEEVLNQNILDAAFTGHNILMELAKTATSEQVKAACAAKLLDYAGHKPGDKITVVTEKPEDELDQEIQQLQSEIYGQKHLDS